MKLPVTLTGFLNPREEPFKQGDIVDVKHGDTTLRGRVIGLEGVKDEERNDVVRVTVEPLGVPSRHSSISAEEEES